jgi:hypothetical protein
LAQESLSTATVRRPDPRTSELVPVEPEQIQPGKIYNHFSQHHGRYVWAFAKAGGRFSYALGIGSTELPNNFDLPTSKRKTTELIEEASGAWFERSRSEGSKVFVRLGADEKWQVLRSRSIRSHFDIDNSRRWEWHGKRRVAVRHTNGYRWRYDGDRYIPANFRLSPDYSRGALPIARTIA